MKAHQKRIEEIVPRLVAGRIEADGDRILYVKATGGSVPLPKECAFCLEELARGKTIRDIVLQSFAAGTPTDFVSLKKTLLSLYWGHALKNSYEFRSELEDSHWLPTSESHLLQPIEEFELDRKPFLFKIFAFLLCSGLSFFSAQLFFKDDIYLSALLFFPLAFLSAKGVGSVIISSFFHRNPQRMSLHVSLMGLYLRESSEEQKPMGVFEFFLHSILTLGLLTLSYFQFSRISNPLVETYGNILILLLLALHFSPAYKSDLSSYFMYVETKRAFTPFAIFILGVFAYTLFSFGYLFFSIKTYVQSIASHEIQTPLLIFAFISILFFLDLLDVSDFILDRLQGTTTSPFYTFFKNIFTKNSSERNYELLQAVPIFQNLPEKTLREMNKRAKVIHVKAGTPLCRDGQRSTDLYVVLRGRVGIYNPSPHGKPLKVMELGEGAIFGEGGFFLNRPRKGDALSLTKTTVLCVKRPPKLESEKDKGLSDPAFQKKVWAFQSLAASPLFKEIPPELIMQIVNQGRIIDIPAQEILIKEGDLPDSMYVIVEGECRTTKGHGAKIGSGNVVGEIGILWNARRTATVVTTTKVIALRIDAQQIWNILSVSLYLGATLQSLGQQRLIANAA